MSGALDNLTVLSQWDDDGPHPLRTLRPRAPDRASRDPLGAETGLASLEVDHLLIGDTIGEGGMGVVRSAVQRSLGREVAVKMVRPAKDRDDARRRVLHEGLVTGALEHPNVVPVHDLRQDEDGRPILVLKRVEGEPWSELLAHPERVTERFGTTDLQEWNGRVLLQVCNAVSFAHSRGILHRDLKPENVMIGRFGEVYVMDWGLAVALPGCALDRIPKASDPRGVAGTPAYMAPEQASPELPLGVACDVWLAGAMLYEAMHGHPPHRPDPTLTGEAAVADALARARAGQVRISPDLPPPVQRMLARALAPDPKDRYASVEDFRRDLQLGLERRQAMLLRQEADRQQAQLLRYLEGVPEPREVATRLGAVRFAYQRVLESWPDGEGAQRGRHAALTAVARWYLKAGEWSAAEHLLSELDAPDPELSAEVASARDQERERLERLRQAEDRSAGVRTRTFVLLVVGSIWVLGPIVDRVTGLGYPSTYPHLLAISAGLAGVGAALVAWGRDSLSRSAMNRQIRYIVVVAPALYGLAVLGSWLMGLQADQAHALPLLVFAAMCAIEVRAMGRSMAVPAVGYMLAFLLSCWRLDLQHYALGASNLVFVWSVLREGWEPLRAAIAEDLPHA